MKNLTALFALAATAASAASGRYAAPHGDVVKIWPDGKMPVVSTNQTYAPFMEFFRPEKQTPLKERIESMNAYFSYMGDHFGHV